MKPLILRKKFGRFAPFSPPSHPCGLFSSVLCFSLNLPPCGSTIWLKTLNNSNWLVLKWAVFGYFSGGVELFLSEIFQLCVTENAVSTPYHVRIWFDKY